MDQPDPEGSETALCAAMMVAAVAVAALIIVSRWYRLRGVPDRPAPFAASTAIALAMACLLLGMLGVQASAGFGVDVSGTGGPETLADQVRVAIGAYAGQAIVVLAYAWQLARLPALDPDRRRSPVAAAGIGMLAIALVWPILTTVGWALTALMERMTGTPQDAVAHDTLRLLVESPVDRWFVITVLLVVIATPVVEEVLYRGLLQEAMRRAGIGPWTSIALTSTLFAVMHWDNSEPHAVALLFGLGLGFGWAFERTGRLTTSIVMHAVFNLVNVVIATA